MRRSTLAFSLLLTTSVAAAAIPIDGWYSNIFGGYAYLPNNMATSRSSVTYTDANYESEYNLGGSFGYKSNPMRYEGQVTYINAMLNHVYENGQRETLAAGYNNAIFGLANVYYDFPMIIPTISPYLGAGLGYGWINVKVDNARLNISDFRVADSAFTYQGTAGITFNFAENYALHVAYRYLATNTVFDLGKRFQAHLANVGVTYRYDEAKYK
ncbi:MAG: outer membrane beta-barrel protein [Gammaproteobacteria bacterium]|nr:outer membrane beta-barrel protein [Gammaproteobacteria bacterium]